MAEVFRAKEAFAFTDRDGVPRVIAPGALISSDDPNYRGKEHLFEPVAVAAARAAGVEQATAEPGERRSLTSPKAAVKRAPAKVDAKQAPKPAEKNEG